MNSFTAGQRTLTNEDNIKNEDDETNNTTTSAVLPRVGFDAHGSCHGEGSHGQLKEHWEEGLIHRDGCC